MANIKITLQFPSRSRNEKRLVVAFAVWLRLSSYSQCDMKKRLKFLWFPLSLEFLFLWE